MITEARTDEERARVQKLFHENFAEIHDAAVPTVSSDDIYAPLVLQYHDPESGKLIGAALTCRAQVAGSAILGSRSGLLNDRLRGYLRFADKHRELDLMCVEPGSRGRSLGTEMLRYMEQRLRELGVRVWFGNTTPDLEVARLRRFYERNGFRVLPDGQDLPPLLGQDWVMPGTPTPAFWFYKTLK